MCEVKSKSLTEADWKQQPVNVTSYCGWCEEPPYGVQYESQAQQQKLCGDFIFHLGFVSCHCLRRCHQNEKWKLINGIWKMMPS